MISLQNLTPTQRDQLRNIVLGYIAWVVVSIFAYTFILPAEWKWLAYLPIAFLILAGVLTIVAIFIRPMLPKPIVRVYVGRRCVTCCQYCPMADVKDNLVNNSFPVVTCRETAKICYTPMKIPRWCPYAD